jgi:hypothetical protein
MGAGGQHRSVAVGNELMLTTNAAGCKSKVDVVFHRSYCSHNDRPASATWHSSLAAPIAWLPVSLGHRALSGVKLPGELRRVLPCPRRLRHHESRNRSRAVGSPSSTTLFSWSAGTLSSSRNMGISRITSMSEDRRRKNRSESPCCTRVASNSQNRARISAKSTRSLDFFCAAPTAATSRISLLKAKMGEFK